MHWMLLVANILSIKYIHAHAELTVEVSVFSAHIKYVTLQLVILCFETWTDDAGDTSRAFTSR